MASTPRLIPRVDHCNAGHLASGDCNEPVAVMIDDHTTGRVITDGACIMGARAIIDSMATEPRAYRGLTIRPIWPSDFDYPTIPREFDAAVAAIRKGGK